MAKPYKSLQGTMSPERRASARARAARMLLELRMRVPEPAHDEVCVTPYGGVGRIRQARGAT